MDKLRDARQVALREVPALRGGWLMPPRARATTGPEFMTSATLGDLIAAELETLAAPPAPNGDGHLEHAAPALSPTERARRSMLNRAAAEIRAAHEPADGES